MELKKLVECYEKISATQKRLEILDYLTDLFKYIKEHKEEAEDLEKVIYLTQGNLYPEMSETPKLGLAEKLLLSAMSHYYGISINVLQKKMRELGDIGSMGEYFAKKQSKSLAQITSFLPSEDNKEDKLTVSDLYKKLEEIASISGPGSVEKKINKLNWLFARSSPLMIKYILRIITSTLRVGVSDPTIMDALANAYLNDKAYREDIERAYNVYPDLGYVARQLHEKGLEGVRNIKAQVGIPIRMMLASRLPYTQIIEKFGGKTFLSELKLDGERLQVHKDGNKIKIFSRRLTNITDQYPDVAEEVRKQVKIDKCIIEGEAVAMDPLYENMLPFQLLITRKRKYDIKKKIEEVPVCLFVFDVLYIERDGIEEIIMDYPLLKRREILKKIVNETNKIKLVEGRFISSTEELVEYFKYARSINTEGLMNKSIDPEKSIYKAGNRGYLWIKLKSLKAGKMTDTLAVTVIGALWGKGKRVNTYGTLLVAVYNEENDKFEYLTRVASGFSDDDLDLFMKILKTYRTNNQPNNVICSEKPDIWFNPGVIIEISGDELTISPKADAGKYYNGKINETGFSVRFPVFQRIRDDLDLYNITKVDELVDLYEIQNQ
ncbi:MAG: ATP-dependent DNA ligase [Promethearchaeota archaeon]